ncbi:krab-a domain-containing protein [Moniliophthora roreri MCA 2997]|nr:krab-a domain-containing protein [Moniliophthora roreri MCA 2997]
MPYRTDVIPDSLDQSDPERNIFTWNKGENSAFKEEHIKEVLRQVTIGSSLTPGEQVQVENLIREFADNFALSISEVRLVKNAVHRLNVPEGIDELIVAGVIAQCMPNKVKCISPTILAKKAHEGGGLLLEELQHRINDQCVAAGLENQFKNLPPRPEPDEETELKLLKWHICQNFAEVNKYTEITPMLQGDICMKQQALSGHKYLSLVDFASGFYAVEVAPEARPYTAFYVKGRGYFWYCKMPFSLTGAPSTFTHMTATRLPELLGDGTLELFIDDAGTAADTFEEMMAKLRCIITVVRREGLSLSASKSQFFVTEGIFAGGKVTKEGVTTDPAKLTAIVDWPTPDNTIQLLSFIGLTSHFRDLIKDYA